MRTITKTIELYPFEELSEEAKQKAIDNLRDINVDYYWYYDEYLEELAGEYGITLKWPDMCFDLDRGAYFYLDTHDHGKPQDHSRIEDEKKLLKKAGIDLRSKDAKQIMYYGLSLDMVHYGGGSGRNTIDTRECELSEDTENKLDALLKDFESTMLKVLRDDYEWRISDEAIIDTINANEYEFTKDGELTSCE